ncbi:MAG: hypothetical protein ABI592_10015 [Acidobacteriota bacterium]
MNETNSTPEEPAAPAPAEPEISEDDRRAAAAAENRKRALDEWEANKRRWKEMGVPQGLPAKK